MLVEKTERLCAECGETMVLTQDYGISGEVFECRLCGYSREVIDLRKTILDRVN
jgi:DNA-directed RNA polymerase subunit M/transcription elongation factor TFIIS